MRFELMEDYLTTIGEIVGSLGLPVRRESLGMSAQGRDIVAYALEGLPKNLLVLGFPHPNEPLSQVVVHRMLERAGELAGTGDGTWWLVPAWDVDGAHMNERWWAHGGGPTLVDAAEGWFRPAARHQVEWDFPLSYDGYEHDMALPETAAVAHLIDRVRPDGLASLHNGTVGAAYAYAGGPKPSFPRDVSAALADSGLEILGHSPVPYCKELAAGVFTFPLAEREIDFLKATGDLGPDYASGAASFEYVGEDCLSLVLELPLFTLDASLVSDTPAELGGRLGKLWNRFEGDLEAVFPREDTDTATNLLLSSPREFWERRRSDGTYVRSVAEQMLGWSHEEAVDRYLGLIFSAATQYAQMSRALGREIGGHAACLDELSRLADATRLTDEGSIRRVADGIVRALVGR